MLKAECHLSKFYFLHKVFDLDKIENKDLIYYAIYRHKIC